MYYISYGKLKELKAKDFVEAYSDEYFIKKINELVGPLGMKYVDAYFVMMGAEHTVEVWYEIDNMGVLDKTTNENAELKALREEWLGKYGILFDWAQSKILKSVTKVNLIDPEKIKKG